MMTTTQSPDEQHRRVLITGSRDANSWDVYAYLERVVHDTDTIIHGACPTGADRAARNYCLYFGNTEEPHPADWTTNGKAAGPIRNQQMVDLGADLCIAFYKTGATNRGTNDCVRRAKAAGITVKEITLP